MSDGNQRELNVTLKLSAAVNNRAIVDETRKAVETLGRELDRTASTASKAQSQMTAGWKASGDELLASIKKASTARIEDELAARRHGAAVEHSSRALIDAQQKAARAARVLNEEMQRTRDVWANMNPQQRAAALASVADKTNDLAKATDKLSKEEEKHARYLVLARDAEQRLTEEREAAQKQAEAAAEAQSRYNRAAEDLEKSLKGVTNSVTQLARGYVLLLVSEEENAQAALQMIARFEAIANLLNGTIKLVSQATKAWEAYRAILASVAAVEAVSGAAGAAGAASSAAGAASQRASSQLLGNLATGMASGWAGARGGAAMAGAGGRFGALAAGATGLAGRGIGFMAGAAPTIAGGLGVAGIGAVGYDIMAGQYGQEGTFSHKGAMFLDKWLPGRSSTEIEQASNDKYARRQQERGQRYFNLRATEDHQANMAAMQAAVGRTGIDARRARNDAAMESVTARMKETGSIDTLSNDDQIRALERQKELARDAMRLAEERADIEKETQAKEIEVAREKAALAAKSLADLEKEKGLLQNEADRFASLSKVEQQATLRAAEKANRGGPLTERERERLEGWSQFKDKTESLNLAEAEKAGAGRDLIDIKRLRSLNDTEIPKAKIEAKTTAEIVLRLEGDFQKVIDNADAKFKEVMMQLSEQLFKSEEKQRALQLLVEQLAAQQNQQ